MVGRRARHLIYVHRSVGSGCESANCSSDEMHRNWVSCELSRQTQMAGLSLLVTIVDRLKTCSHGF